MMSAALDAYGFRFIALFCWRGNGLGDRGKAASGNEGRLESRRRSKASDLVSPYESFTNIFVDVQSIL